MPTIVRFATGLLLAALIAGCASSPAPPELAFVIVRHAEKVADGSADPALSDAGRARAAALAGSLADAPVVAVYATGYRRTRETATPTAARHDLPVTTYDAAQPAAAFATQLRQAHRGGRVLVVGHSNTAAAIAAALCGCDVPPLHEQEYDRHMTVHIGADGAVTLLSASMP